MPILCRVHLEPRNTTIYKPPPLAPRAPRTPEQMAQKGMGPGWGLAIVLLPRPARPQCLMVLIFFLFFFLSSYAQGLSARGLAGDEQGPQAVPGSPGHPDTHYSNAARCKFPAVTLQGWPAGPPVVVGISQITYLRCDCGRSKMNEWVVPCVGCSVGCSVCCSVWCSVAYQCTFCRPSMSPRGIPKGDRIIPRY